MPKEQTPDQQRFSEVVKIASNAAYNRRCDIEIGYDETTDQLFFAVASEMIVDSEALQATVKPDGKICEAKTINPKFCEV